MAGGVVVVPVRSHIPIIVHIPAQRGGAHAHGVDTTTEGLGLAPYPVHGATGPGPGMN